MRRVDELSRTITGLGIVPLAWVAWRKGARAALLSRLTLAGLALPAAAVLISVLTRKDGERSE